MKPHRALLMTLLLAASMCVCASTQPAAVDPPPVPSGAVVPLDHLPGLKGDYFPISSRATGRDYHVYVRFPEGYDADDGRLWPVVYLLDGDSLFPILAPTHLFLGYDEQLPEAIVVGIAYGGFDPEINKRNVDFTALAADTRPGEGGAEPFHRFLSEELLPEVEGRHRADATRRVLLGQSRSGYFVLWSALHDPDLFWGRIASNPAFVPAHDQLLAAPNPYRRNDLAVVIVSGARDTEERMRNGTQWQAHWSGQPDAPWKAEQIVLPEGTHAASIGEAYRRAMLWLFDDEIAKSSR